MNNKGIKKQLDFKKAKGVLIILVLFITTGIIGWKNVNGDIKDNNTDKYAASNNDVTKKRRLDEAGNEAEDIKEEEATGTEAAAKDAVEEDRVESDEPPQVVGKRLNVGLICQLPELYNGCEVTSLAMLLNYKGIWVDKLQLADNMIKDDTAVVQDDYGNILIWGNPSVGFVGDVTGNSIGYAINPEPLIPLVNQYYSGGAVNLTGCNIEALKTSIDNDNPVIVWINENFVMPIEYTSWKDSYGNDILANFDTHAVLLTGYDEGNFYYNDPLSGYKDASINFKTFETVWSAMGSKALSVN